MTEAQESNYYYPQLRHLLHGEQFDPQLLLSTGLLSVLGQETEPEVAPVRSG